jgi:hypothetical protein
MTAASAQAPIEDLYKQFPLSKTNSGIKYIDLSDGYTAWLGYANAGMLNKGNLLCFDYALRHLPSKNPMVEIGLFAGLSTNLLTYFKQKHGVTNTLFNCDKWIFESSGEGSLCGGPVTHAQYRTFVRDSYIRNVRTFSHESLPHTIEAFSDEFFTAWREGRTTTDVFGRTAQLGGPISFCYIDGNHTYDFAKRDFEHTDQFLEPGGFVLFDDSADGSIWEVSRVIEEVKKLPNYRFVVKNPNYMFQKVA